MQFHKVIFILGSIITTAAVDLAHDDVSWGEGFETPSCGAGDASVVIGCGGYIANGCGIDKHIVFRRCIKCYRWVDGDECARYGYCCRGDVDCFHCGVIRGFFDGDKSRALLNGFVVGDGEIGSRRHPDDVIGRSNGSNRRRCGVGGESGEIPCAVAGDASEEVRSRG